jgi:hypothetical protein
MEGRLFEKPPDTGPSAACAVNGWTDLYPAVFNLRAQRRRPQQDYRAGVLCRYSEGGFQSSRKSWLVRKMVVRWQYRDDRIIVDLFDAEKTVQYRRRRASVRRLHNTLRWADSPLLHVEGSMAPG